MYSDAPFAVLSQPQGDGYGDAVKQIRILYDICKKPSGILVHAYDAIRKHLWANPVTGTSPEVWCRAQEWYTLGLLNTRRLGLNDPAMTKSATFKKSRKIFSNLVAAQTSTSEEISKQTARYGIWQVVDKPGAEGNFIEASSSFMTLYLLAAARLGQASPCRIHDSTQAAKHIYSKVSEMHRLPNGNRTLRLKGTSSVASLSGDVIYEYYVTRSTELNSLLGTSAFIMASVEMDRLGIFP